jgi:SAM-dependent methyltransferase
VTWYEDWFDSEAYELVYDQRDLSEARRLADLIERTFHPAPGATILDVGCGRGRHARILAAKGYDVTGVDLSENALRTARRRAEREGVEVTFRQEDMRDLPFEAAFDGVVNLFTTFGYFEDDADHQRAVDAMARALRPGGWLVQDFLNAPYAVAHLVPEDERALDGYHITQRRWTEHDTNGDRINKQIMLSWQDESLTYTESVRLLTAEDFRRMYFAAGLEVAHTFGDYDGGPHTAGAPRLILMARRTT